MVSMPWLVLARSLALALVVAGAMALTAAPARAQSAAPSDDLKEGDGYFEEGNYRRAAQRYDSAIEKWPGLVPAEAYGKRAAIYIIQKDYRAGLDFITRSAEPRHPDAPEVLEQKALILWLLGRRAEAIDVAEKVVARRPDMYSNQRIIGEFHASSTAPGAPDKAIAAYEAYLAHRPASLANTDVLPRVRLGFAYLGARQPREAQAQFELLLDRYRDRPHAEVNARNGLCAAYTALEAFDRAIALCEEIVRTPGHVDAGGSAWYNLAQAYLHTRRPEPARAAARAFTRLRKSSPKGHIVIGDAYFQEHDWSSALDHYIRAEKLARGKRGVELGIKLGATYRRLDRLDEAIAKLEAAFASHPGDTALVIELGGAYLAAKQDARALAAVDRLITGRALSRAEPAAQASLLVLSARALYNQGQAREARQRYQAARDLYPEGPEGAAIRAGLIQAINLQAHQALAAGDADGIRQAEQHLRAAHELDHRAVMTNRNLAVLALDRGQCDRAREYLAALAGAPDQALLYHRLLARAYLCQQAPDVERAAEHYARAEKEATAADSADSADSIRAEIYTEWAPIIAGRDLDDAVDKLRQADKLAGSPEVREAALRHLAVVLFRRGWHNLRAGKPVAAVDDFRVALAEERLLSEVERLAFEFSLALAYLEKGETTRVVRLFDKLAEIGGQERYLKAPYDKVGTEFFAAYAKYRSGSNTLRKRAARDLERMRRRARGEFGDMVRDLLASTWSYIAYDEFQEGDTSAARKALKNADKHAVSAKVKRGIAHNQAVLAMGASGAPAAAMAVFERLDSTYAEAAANLGVIYDRQGKSRQAHDKWIEARQRGLRDRELQRWIDAKKRIFGY